MQLLASNHDFLDWASEASVPDGPVECQNIDSETVQCDVTVTTTGELYFVLLMQDVDERWLVDWASVSNVDEGGCC